MANLVTGCNTKEPDSYRNAAASRYASGMSTQAKSKLADRNANAFDPAVPPDRPDKSGPAKRGVRPAKSARLAALALIALAATAAAVVGFGILPRKTAQAPVVSIARPPAVVGLGFIEPSSSVIKIGAPGSADALKISTLKVAEGDEVEAGQVLAVLDTADKLAAQVEASEAQLKLKRLILEKQRVEIASNVTSRKSAVERARAELDATKADFDRQKTLLDRGVSTVLILEKRRRELLTAEANVREMEASLKRIGVLATSSTAAPGSLIDIAVTEQEVVSAEADLKVVRANLELATIRAPFKGRVLTINTRAGARIGTDGVLEMGATQSMRAVVEVYQSDIGRVRPGQAVTVKAEVFAEPLGGVVDRISPTVKRQSVVNNDPATATDARVVEVFVAFDEATSRQIATLSRLQVHAVFTP
jgi:HlyD family secretion protein